jgi:hypothetical protein
MGINILPLRRFFMQYVGIYFRTIQAPISN